MSTRSTRSTRMRYRFASTATLADYFAGKASALRAARKLVTRQQDKARLLGEAYAWESAGRILRNSTFELASALDELS
jgi:hypothetical protein